MKKWLETQIKKISEGKAVLLFVFDGDKLIGVSGTELKDKVSSHEGVLGISVADGYRGKGIGKKLFELNISESEKNLKGLRLITLGVFSNNLLAQQMYKKFGFTETGRIPRGILHRGNYVDHIFMYKEV